MTLSDNERDTLIQYCLEQANEAVEDVEILLNHNRFSASVNRIYYGIAQKLEASPPFRSSNYREIGPILKDW